MLNFLPPQLIVTILSATPIIELNGSIPYGLISGLNAWEAIFWSLLGNTLIAAALLLLIKQVIDFTFKHIPILHRTIERRLHKFNRRFQKPIQVLGPIFITIFILVPFPASGTYSSILLADLFEIKFWPSLLSIFIGNLLYAFLITGGFELIVKSFGIA